MAKAKIEIKTNKLNIYLIKDKYKDEDSITNIAEDKEIKRVEINDVGYFYFKRSTPTQPDWLTSFFKNDAAIDTKNFIGSGAKAVLIVKVKHKAKDRFFAIPFGSGRFLLKDSCFEERFGLVTSLNVLESNGLKGIDKRTYSTNPKLSREQISKAGEAIDFQIDFERDLVHSITGRSADINFGNIVTGKEALSVSAKIDKTNIKTFLNKALTIYEKKDYQKNFQWIDQIQEVKDQKILDKLNIELIKKLKKADELVWLAVPEIMDWTAFTGFKYTTRKKDKLYDELIVSELLSESNLDTDFTLEDLQSSFITSWVSDSDNYLHKWNIFSCINAEIELGKKNYFLSHSKWYEINSDFVQSVNNEFKKIEQIDLKLPQYDHATEGEYNSFASKKIKAQCLDAKNIPYGGGHSKIEFCDMLTKDKKLIHVKKYGGSAVLSHLFAQGFVSAELLLTDDVFRKKVIDEYLEAPFKNLVSLGKPKASDYTVVYAIITKQKNKPLSVPFFSRVVLKNYRRILEAYGYNIVLTKIENIKVTDKDDEDED
jgi:uncharacterized protein (TIGR04141 family)